VGNALIAQRMRRFDHVSQAAATDARPKFPARGDSVSPTTAPLFKPATRASRLLSKMMHGHWARNGSSQSVKASGSTPAGRLPLTATMSNWPSQLRESVTKRSQSCPLTSKPEKLKSVTSPSFFGQFDVNTGASRHHLEAVGNAQIAEQQLETVLVVFSPGSRPPSHQYPDPSAPWRR
jgi:hypothetical protein